MYVDLKTGGQRLKVGSSTNIHFNFLQGTPLALYPHMALAVFHSLKDKTNLSVSAVLK